MEASFGSAAAAYIAITLLKFESTPGPQHLQLPTSAAHLLAISQVSLCNDNTALTEVERGASEGAFAIRALGLACTGNVPAP